MARAFVADGDRCLVVEAKTIKVARRSAGRIAACRQRETRQEKRLGEQIDRVFGGAITKWDSWR